MGRLQVRQSHQICGLTCLKVIASCWRGRAQENVWVSSRGSAPGTWESWLGVNTQWWLGAKWRGAFPQVHMESMWKWSSSYRPEGESSDSLCNRNVTLQLSCLFPSYKLCGGGRWQRLSIFTFFIWIFPPCIYFWHVLILVHFVLGGAWVPQYGCRGQRTTI